MNGFQVMQLSFMAMIFFFFMWLGVDNMEVDKSAMSILQLEVSSTQNFSVKVAPPWDFYLIEKFSLLGNSDYLCLPWIN